MIEALLLAAASTVLEPVVVSGRRGGPQLAPPFALAQLDAEALAQSGPGLQASEALTRLPGIWAADRGNHAQDVQLSVRGFGARTSFGVRGLRLFVDGLPASSADGSGAVSAFPLGEARRIELLRGPFSALEGASSGGVLALHTQAPSPGRELRLGADDAGARWAALNVSSASARASLQRWSTPGWRAQARAERSLLDLRWDPAPGWLLKASHLDQPAQDPLGLSRAQLAADPRSTAPQAAQFDTRKRLRAQQLGAVHQGQGMQLRAWLGQRQLAQWQAIAPAVQAAPSHPGGVIDLDRLSAGLDARAWVGGWTLGLQAETQREHRRGFENFVGAQGGVSGALRRDERNRADALEAYVQHQHDVGTLQLHTGLRAGQLRLRTRDRYLANGDDSGARALPLLQPVLGLSWAPQPRERFFLALGAARETPTLNELAYRSDGAAGLNLALRAQASRQAEIGWKQRGAALDAELVAFTARTADEIVSARNSGGRSAFANAPGTQRQGLEAQAAWRFAPGWRLDGAATLMSARVRQAYSVCGAPPCSQPAAPVAAGARLPGVPARALRLDLQQQLDVAWAWGLTLQGRSRLWADERNSEAAAGFSTLAAWARWQQGAWRISLRADDLSDRRGIASVIVNEANGRFFEPGPGRRLSLTLAWQP